MSYDKNEWLHITNDTSEFTLNGVVTPGKVVDVYDGDTCKICFPWRDTVYKWNCRIQGVDTPELRTRNVMEKSWGYMVRDKVREVLLDEVVKVYCGEFDKYGRLLVDIETTQGLNISQWLIEKGYAFSYDGGTKRDWENYLKNMTT